MCKRNLAYILNLNKDEAKSSDLNQTVSHKMRDLWNYEDANTVKSLTFAIQWQKSLATAAVAALTANIIFDCSSLHVLDDEHDSDGNNVNKDKNNSDDL